MAGAILTNIFTLFSSYSLSATAGLLSERSGTVNIALDGKMIIGGLIWALLMTVGGFSGMAGGAFVAILLGGLGAMIYSVLLSIPTVNLHSDHVITGTAINMLAAAIALIVIFVISGTNIITLPPAGSLSGGWAGDIDTTSIIYLIISFIVMGITYVFLKYTKWGLRLKISGENPYSLASAGVSVSRIRHGALLASGFMSGISGGMAMITMWGGVFSGGVYGMGYISLAILIFSRWNLFGIIGGTVVISVAMGFARSWFGLGLNDIIPQEVIAMIPFIIPLVSLVLIKVFYTDRGKGAYGGAPKAVGKPFKKDQR